MASLKSSPSPLSNSSYKFSPQVITSFIHGSLPPDTVKRMRADHASFPSNPDGQESHTFIALPPTRSSCHHAAHLRQPTVTSKSHSPLVGSKRLAVVVPRPVRSRAVLRPILQRRRALYAALRHNSTSTSSHRSEAYRIGALFFHGAAQGASPTRPS
ncbi:hypothetical protein EDB92DRAFT_1102850 [Lactarius akahatsu]|uniref:Uncharacterized protein n=1 Tax=Lactarius akahatsu TaxID=416441 RepID=A0AAD4LDM1_9AGAM|nr:hypothetical protein EDB92DRAFT_1102850 [Lactarius akahatsu]